ncbi:acetylornithine aminotransferase [Auriculariales sp. MPI-PUGE-AT-0066]|nr:acetylornithine aminotransferase [Auriculariales sp. MPI-PUGE-AT-0066]
MFKPTRAALSSLQSLKRHVAPGVAKQSQDVILNGKGTYINTISGKRLLDFTSGIGVLCLGHAHPKVSGAAAAQCMKVVHAQTSSMHHEPQLRLIEKLLPVMPDTSLDTFFFTTTGAEAVEAAMKLARQATGRPNIIVMRGGYHGRSVGTVSLTTSKTIYSIGAHPLMPGVYPTAFPYWHQFGASPTTATEELVKKALFDLDLVLAQQTAPKDTAAILIEPVLGEGGYVPVPPAYLQALREVCDKHGLLLICDEVQSGFGRTGKYFALEHSGVRPDVMVMAKGIANGFPLSGIVSTSALMGKQPPGSMGGTYAGNAVATAAAIAVQEAFAEENILSNVGSRSTQLFGALEKLRKKPEVAPHILDVRGEGLMVGVEFASPGGMVNDPLTKVDAPKSLASRVSARCLDKGMLLLTTSIFETVRFIPPLNVSEQEMNEGCSIFAEAVEEVVKEG